MIFLLLSGVILLYLGAEGFIRGGVSLAARLQISSLIIGLTVIAFSTSSPEIAVTLEAAKQGYSNAALGNILGSCIANTCGVLGLCACFRPIQLTQQILRFDLPICLFAYLLFTIPSLIWHQLPQALGICFVLLLIGYTCAVYFFHQKKHPQQMRQPSICCMCLFLVGGLVLLIVGSQLLVHSAISLAKLYGVDERVIGITILAVGTSLPEMSCSLLALWKKEQQILIGNIIGSNIFNILFVLGITTIVYPLHNLQLHLWDCVILFGSLLALFPLFQKSLSITRVKGGILLSLYCVYLVFLFKTGS